MKNLNEEINRIKKIITINEQCDGDWDQCKEDLEGMNYKVFSPDDLKTSCEENTIITCVNDVLTDSGISNIIISSRGSGTKDCYVLVKSDKTQSGVPKFMITFYSDNQVVIESTLGNDNDNEIVLYRGKYECNGGNLKILGGKFEYIGVRKAGSAKIINGDVKDQYGDFVIVDPTESANYNIPEDKLKYKNFLTYYTNLALGTVTNTNILINGLTNPQIIDLLTHT